jgi:hypothetical protein
MEADAGGVGSGAGNMGGGDAIFSGANIGRVCCSGMPKNGGLASGGEFWKVSMGVNISGWLWTLVVLEWPAYGEVGNCGTLVNISEGLWNMSCSSFDQPLTKEPASE